MRGQAAVTTATFAVWGHGDSEGMGSRPQPQNLQREAGRLLHAALVEQEEDEDEEEGSEDSRSDSISPAEPLTMPTFDVPYFRYIDDEGTEGEEEWSSSRSLSSIEEDSSTDSAVPDRFVVVSGTPEKILEHLLEDLSLEEDQGTTHGNESGGHAYFHFCTSSHYRGSMNEGVFIAKTAKRGIVCPEISK